MYVPQLTLRSGEIYYLYGPYLDTPWIEKATKFANKIENHRDEPHWKIEGRSLSFGFWLFKRAEKYKDQSN